MAWQLNTTSDYLSWVYMIRLAIPLLLVAGVAAADSYQPPLKPTDRDRAILFCGSLHGEGYIKFWFAGEGYTMELACK
jgi:hypothetical protein